MILFQKAASLGDELIVGIHNDDDVASYKRKPNVSHNERCDTVAVCKYVTEVIPNAPLVMDEDFIKKHKIDLVVCSEEYDSPDDKYYAVARKNGILRVLPRTQGISSSDLMRIIMSRKTD
jgi:cytidyltransferase-like protein